MVYYLSNDRRKNYNLSEHRLVYSPKICRGCKGLFGSIALDPCSNEWSIVGAGTEFILPEDGLGKDWNYPTIYVNPPYGADRERGTTIKEWLRKCVHAHGHYGAEVLALVPVATNTSHWKEYVWGRATAICFLYDTRLKFLIGGRSGKGAPMACAMIYWGKDTTGFFEVFSKFGAVIITC